MAYPLGVYDPVAPQVLADLRKTDAPKCMIPETPAAASRGGPTRWVARTVKSCPAMDQWATENWQRWWLKWLATHPGSAVRLIDSQIFHSLAPSVWGNVVAATPASVADLFFGPQALPQSAHPTLTYRIQPLILWTIAGAGLAIAATRRRLWRGTPWGVDLMLAATVLGGLATAVSSGLLIQTMPHEVAQESLGATAVLTAAVVAAVGLGWDRLLGRTTKDALERPRRSDPTAEE
jgi:hypothetical protein